MILAIVNNSVVTQVLTIPDDGGVSYVQVAQGAQAAIDITNMNPQPVIGYIFDGANLWPPPGYVPPTKITKLAFRERFTITEMTMIYSAMATNFTLQAMVSNQTVSTFIDLSRSDTIAGVDYLVAIGIITAARAVTILTTPPVASELYIAGS